ncbi:hypothetical protein ACFE04_029846 [Oxalis oulophora]
MSLAIREVWDSNFTHEMICISLSLEKYHVVAIDTEFPGFILKCDRDAPEAERYSMMKHNVDNTKLIQLGITLSDNYGNIGGSWEFNFRDFDCSTDLSDHTSIAFLKKNGMNLEKINTQGISLQNFRQAFGNLLTRHHQYMKWVVFHGLYDFAYLLRLMTGKPLPELPIQFAQSIGSIFGYVLDLKYIGGFCAKLSGTVLGLEKLAKILKVERIGGAHHAGSDSLLTASIFSKMKELFQIQDDDYGGFLYGLSSRATIRIYPKPVFVQHPPIPVPLFVRRPIIRSLYRPVCSLYPMMPDQPPVFIPVATLRRDFHIV